MNRGLIKAAIIFSSVVLAGALIALVIMLFGDRIWNAAVPQRPAVPVTDVPTEEPTTEAASTALKTVEVPSVIGMTASEAYETLNYNGVRYTVSREYSDTVPAETVIGQFPMSGTIPQSDRVILFISKGVDNTSPVTEPPTKPKKSSSKSSEKSSDSGSKGGYIIDGSDTRLISADELRGLSEDELTLALNEIYARHGRRFKTDFIREYFESRSWYNGTIDPEDFDESRITAVERANINTIVEVMEELGYR